MGIPGLTTKIGSYAEHHILHNHAGNDVQLAIIDGPAMAWHILGLCRAQTGSSAVSYDFLARATMTWLDALGSYGFKIHAILFDGFLPETKRSERLRRLQNSTSVLFNARAQCSNRPLGTTAHVENSDLRVTQKATSTSSSGSIPPLEFVHSIYAALRGSNSAYAAITSMVWGEADMFCAEIARSIPAYLFSGDSDLLVHRIGPDGRVVFFRDMEFDMIDGIASLVVAAYHPAGIAKRLDIADLLDMAWYLTEDRFRSIPEAAALAKQASPSGPEYLEFVAQFSSPTAPALIGSLKAANVNDLGWICGDFSSRFLEMVLQVSIETKTTTAVAPASVHVFLPAVLEDPSRASAFGPGSEIRRQTYSLLRCLNSNLTRVEEYHRRGSKAAPNAVHLLDTEELYEALESLSNWLEWSHEHYDFLPLQARWRAMAISMICHDKREAGKAKPSPDLILAFVANHVSVQLTWDIIHFRAEWQSLLYSLDMLRQMRSFLTRMVGVVQLDLDLILVVNKISIVLDSLPGPGPLYDWNDCGLQEQDMILLLEEAESMVA